MKERRVKRETATNYRRCDQSIHLQAATDFYLDQAVSWVPDWFDNSVIFQFDILSLRHTPNAITPSPTSDGIHPISFSS